MRAHRARSGGYVVALLLIVMAMHQTAWADRQTVADDTESSDSQTDISSVEHGHGPSHRILRHEIHFDGQPGPLVSHSVSLFFRFRNRRGEDVRRELAIRTNPDGGLYGAFLTRRNEVTGYARAWMQDSSTLVVEFSVPALGRPKGERYRWHAWSILGAGEFDDPCAAEDEGPPICRDRAPAEGSVVHRL